MGIRFTTGTNRVQCGSATVLANVTTGNFTISCWVYPFSTGDGGYGLFMAKDNVGSGLGNGWSFGFNGDVANTSIHYERNGGTDLNVKTSGLNPLLNWYNFLVTGDGSVTAANYHIYVNGVEQTYSGNADGATFGSDALMNFTIGNEDTAGGTSFDGIICETAMWNIQLPLNQIQTLGKARLVGIPLQMSPSNLVGYWPIDEFPEGATASGSNTIRDRSSQSNHGTPLVNPVARSQSILSYI